MNIAEIMPAWLFHTIFSSDCLVMLIVLVTRDIRHINKIFSYIFLSNRLMNDSIRERVGVAPIVEKLVENRLRWFGHVERRPVDAVVRRVDQMEESQVKRGRGRPRKTIRETIRKDLEVNELDPNLVYDRTLWRNLIHVVDPT